MPSAASCRSTSICVAMPAWSVPPRIRGSHVERFFTPVGRCAEARLQCPKGLDVLLLCQFGLRFFFSQTRSHLCVWRRKSPMQRQSGSAWQPKSLVTAHPMEPCQDLPARHGHRKRPRNPRDIQATGIFQADEHGMTSGECRPASPFWENRWVSLINGIKPNKRTPMGTGSILVAGAHFKILQAMNWLVTSKSAVTG